MNGLISTEPFIPHTLEHLTQIRAFPNPLPEAAYAKILHEYEKVDDVRVSRIAYDSDGLAVTGLMALPEKLRTGAHPLLIYNRGGSREYGKLTVLSAMRSMVPFARAGYLVFASNYRGNDGGEGREEFGGADMDDVMNLLAMARGHDAFDGRNANMIGHSRGGMMTALAIRKGAALNSAVSIAGIADVRPFVQEARMVENVFKPLIPGYEPSPERALAERSPVCWPEAISVPLLLLHGDADKDVPVSDSRRLEEALMRLRRTCELVVYPGGNHALVRVWGDVVAQCLRWMERFRA